MEKLYHIFQVYNYKGGELLTDINNNYDDFVVTMSDIFVNYINTYKEIEKNPIQDAVVDILRKTIEDSYFTDIYAGREAQFCGKTYETMGDGSLLRINPFTEEWLEKYAEQILVWYEEDLN